MSKRDELVEGLTTVYDQLRLNLNEVILNVNSNSSNRLNSNSISQPIQNLTNSISNLLDLPPINGTNRQSELLPIASTSTSTTTSLISIEGTSPITIIRPYYASHHSTATLRSPGLIDNNLSTAPGDLLPAYSRIVPLNAIIPEVPRTIHTFNSKSNKLKVEINAAGEGSRIVLIQSPTSDGKVFVEGLVTLTLTHPETITYLRIRLKGIVKTLVMKVQGSGRSSLIDERLFWEDAVTLWTQEDNGNLPTNTSPDAKHHQGTFTFPFKLHIPSRVNRPGPSNGSSSSGSSTPVHSMRLPPSFVLSGEQGNTLGEWASCRYFIKLTLGRKGLMKINERLVMPLIYLPSAADPIGSPAYMQAIAEGRRPPGPLEDPTGWSGKKMSRVVKRGVFSPKKAKYDVTLLLPTPGKFSRYTYLPFAIKITSNDTSITTKFEGSITVYLLQRSLVSAQGLTTTHDSMVAKSVLHPDGPSHGQALTGDKDGMIWGKRLTGKIKLTSSVGSNFSVPNLSISYYVIVRVSVVGPGNDLELAVPVQIIPSARTTYPVALPTLPGAPLETPPPAFYNLGRTISSLGDGAGLPPSYFDVMEHES